jgi:hypothetical protein
MVVRREALARLLFEIRRFLLVLQSAPLDGVAFDPFSVEQDDLVPPEVGAGRWNVGSEINGKSRLFSRPVIIYKKLAHGFYFVIPTTTKSKVGSWFVPFRQADREMVASLHQARAIDHRRLSTKLGQLDDSDFDRVREGFWKLYK